MTGQSPEDARLSVHTNSQSLSVNQNSRVWKKKRLCLISTNQALAQRGPNFHDIRKSPSLPSHSSLSFENCTLPAWHPCKATCQRAGGCNVEELAV